MKNGTPWGSWACVSTTALLLLLSGVFKQCTCLPACQYPCMPLSHVCINCLALQALDFAILKIYYASNYINSPFAVTVVKVKMSVAQLCLTLCDPVDCSPPGPSVHGILQARILEWVALSSSRGSSWPRNPTQVSHIAGRFFIIWATREDLMVERVFFFFKDLFWSGPFLKPVLNFLQYCFCFIFWVFFGYQACEILAPWPGIRTCTPCIGRRSLKPLDYQGSSQRVSFYSRIHKKNSLLKSRRLAQFTVSRVQWLILWITSLWNFKYLIP